MQRYVDLADGRTIGVPLAWFPRLLNAIAEERAHVRIGVTGRGLHWEELNEEFPWTVCWRDAAI